MNTIYAILDEIYEAIIYTGKIALFIATLPLVLLYLRARLKIEKELRSKGQWPN